MAAGPDRTLHAVERSAEPERADSRLTLTQRGALRARSEDSRSCFDLSSAKFLARSTIQDLKMPAAVSQSLTSKCIHRGTILPPQQNARSGIASACKRIGPGPGLVVTENTDLQLGADWFDDCR